MSIRHSFESTRPPSPDNTLVDSQKWNAPHVITAVDFPLVDPPDPVDGSFWVVQTSPAPLTLQIRIRIGGVTYSLMEVANPTPVI